MRRAGLAAALVVLAACGADAPAVRAASTAGDADLLGQDLHDLLVRVAAYQASHRGNAPRALRDLGIDSLEPETLRRLEGGTPVVARVEFRRPGRRDVRACRASTDAIDEAALNAGRFTATCVGANGVEAPRVIAGGR